MSQHITLESRVPLTRSLKLRLLQSLRAGVIDMVDYPELQQAGRQVIQMNLEQLTPEEQSITVEAVRILNRYESFQI